jgi:hypothetical protein
MRFCSKACEEAGKKYHDVECTIHAFFGDDDDCTSRSDLLRFVTSTDVNVFLRAENRIRDAVTKTSMKRYKTSAPAIVDGRDVKSGEDAETEDLGNFFAMMYHTSHLSDEEIFEMVVQAGYMVKCLEHAGYFVGVKKNQNRAKVSILISQKTNLKKKPSSKEKNSKFQEY